MIDSKQVVDFPLNVRRFGALAILVPGTTPDAGGFANSDLGSPFSESTYAANGARTSSNNTLIDGVDSRNLTFGGFAVQPSASSATSTTTTAPRAHGRRLYGRLRHRRTGRPVELAGRLSSF